MNVYIPWSLIFPIVFLDLGADVSVTNSEGLFPSNSSSD